MATQKTVPAPKAESARSAIILLVVVLVVAGYSVLHGLQTLAYIEAKSWSRTDPWLYDIPVPLAAPAPIPDFSKSKQKPVMLKTNEWEFMVPWTEQPKQRQLASAVEFRFSSGLAVAFFDPNAQADTLADFKKSNPAAYDKFSAVYQGNPPKTNFELYRDVYSVSPDQMSPMMSVADAMRMNVLMLWKIGFGIDARPGVHSFDWPHVRGFEFGDPARGPVALRIFDDRDHQFRMLLVRSPGASGIFTQDDINFIIQTLQPIPFEER